jgi:hypothetical protein
MASVIRGDDNFDSSGVGAATDWGDVGSYAFAGISGTGFTEGSTTAGSNLRPCGLMRTSFPSNDSYASTLYISIGPNSTSGTWRAMGRYNHGTSYTVYMLWVRIS